MNIQWEPIRAVSDEKLAENARLHDEMVAAQCQCKLTGSKPYLLEIEENRIIDLKCAECGKSMCSEWIEDALSTSEALPVTVKWVRERAWDELADTLYGEIAPRQDGVS